VTGGMRVFVGNDQVEFTEIGPKTVEEVRKNNRKYTTMSEIIDERIYIRAQRETQYRNVVFVMNRLQDSGFYKIALVAEDRRR
jgi:biopolymer transport protein ExbD